MDAGSVLSSDDDLDTGPGRELSQTIDGQVPPSRVARQVGFCALSTSRAGSYIHVTNFCPDVRTPSVIESIAVSDCHRRPMSDTVCTYIFTLLLWRVTLTLPQTR